VYLNRNQNFMKAEDYWPGKPTNDSKLSALPGGGRFANGTFGSKSQVGFYWMSNEYNESSAYVRNVGGGYNTLRTLSKNYGFSVRCVKDKY
jgi:uncharacterized protein (TIGR02145 family)